MDRYHRQTLLPQIGQAGQARLAAARVAIVGCGALGTVAVELLARAGVGHLTLIDRDLVELTNLQRQTLFDESDARETTPKAAAAAGRLRRINSTIAIEPVVADVHAGNAEPLLRDASIVIDGTDNAETRYLLNDVAIKHSLPWVYGAAVATDGRAMLIVPGVTPCLRCLFPTPPAAGELPTCDTVGVLGPQTAVIASLQASLAIRHIAAPGSAPMVLVTADIWQMRFNTVDVSDGRHADCPACMRRNFEFLDRPAEASQATLCGQNAVQLRPAAGTALDLHQLADRLSAAGDVQRTAFLVRCDLRELPGMRITAFMDGRAIIHGTADLSRARSLYARFIGN